MQELTTEDMVAMLAALTDIQQGRAALAGGEPQRSGTGRRGRSTTGAAAASPALVALPAFRGGLLAAVYRCVRL